MSGRHLPMKYDYACIFARDFRRADEFQTISP